MATDQHTATPPEPPQIRREIRFGTTQVIGMSFFLLISLLALAGLFGNTMGTVSARDNDLELQVEFPTRFRYKTNSPLTVTVRTLRPIDSLEVRFARSYISGFSETSFTPDPWRVTGTAYIIMLNDLEPGTVEHIDVEITAERYGSHSGTISASTNTGEDVAVEVSSFVLP